MLNTEKVLILEVDALQVKFLGLILRELGILPDNIVVATDTRAAKIKIATLNRSGMNYLVFFGDLAGYEQQAAIALRLMAQISQRAAVIAYTDCSIPGAQVHAPKITFKPNKQDFDRLIEETMDALRKNTTPEPLAAVA